MAFELIWRGRELVKRFHGRVSAEDFLQAADRIQGDPRFDDLRGIINDLSDCTELDASGLARVKEIAARDFAASLTNVNLRIATVASLERHPLIRDATRAYIESNLSPLPVRVFESMEAARVWLGNAP